MGIKIRDNIQAGRVQESIALVNEQHPALLDSDRYLLFHLQQQQLIELIREQRVEEALKFAADHLAERGEEDSAVLQELERTLALLAFEDPASCPFSDLLAPSHRQQVASELNAAILRAEHAESTQSKLAVMLKRRSWTRRGCAIPTCPLPRGRSRSPSDARCGGAHTALLRSCSQLQLPV